VNQERLTDKGLDRPRPFMCGKRGHPFNSSFRGPPPGISELWSVVAW
jgi:hypothetical protein